MQATDLPLVTVIMPAYNHGLFVKDAIKSVWDQTYQNVELIVLNDGSSDNTKEIVDQLHLNSPIPMRVIHKANEGVCKTLNQGLKLASGKYVSFLASDDKYLPYHCEALVNEYKKYEGTEIGFIFGNVRFMNKNGEDLRRTQFEYYKPASKQLFDDFLFFKNIPQGSANIYRADILRSVGGFNEKYAGEGIDLYLRLAGNYKCVYLDRCLSWYRVSEKNDANLNAQVGLDHDYMLDVFKRHIKKHPRYNKLLWRRIAWASIYAQIAGRYYANRQLHQSRKWCFKSLGIYPLSFSCYSIIIRSLLGAKNLNRLSAAKRKLWL